MPVMTLAERKVRGSRRLRRLAWTAAALLVLVTITAIRDLAHPQREPAR